MMSIAQKWLVCESSGRWAAALRATCARLPKDQPTARLYEVRTLENLSTHLDEQKCDLVLIEVGRENLTEVLQLLVRRGPRLGRFVALKEESAGQSVADLLLEAGAVDVVESPRQLSGLLALHNRLAAVRGPIGGGIGDRQSFTEWAWSTVPWQDA